MATIGPINTDRQVSGLKPSERTYELAVSGARGLIVRVFPTGTRSFEFRYVSINGKRKRMPLGSYPELGLSRARDLAGALRVRVVNGDDPAQERAEAKVAARTGETLAELAEAYWAAAERGLHGGRGRPKTANTLRAEKSRWKRYLVGELGDVKFTELKRRDIKAFMRRLAVGHDLAPDSVASIGRVLSALLAFAVHEERIDANPAHGVTRPLALRSRDRMFDDEALSKIWKALVLASESRVRGEDRPDKHARLEPSTALALRFALLTLCRRGEVAGARWAEIDENARVWIIPAARMKARRPHVVPLSDAALRLLREARLAFGIEEFVFPAHEDLKRPVSPDVMTRALARLCQRHGVPHGTPHDFRRSGATTLTGERYGIRRFVVAKVLAHAADDGASAITAVYDRNDYLADKRTALAAWADHVLGLNGEPSKRSGNIIPFASAKHA
jgi:integrase